MRGLVLVLPLLLAGCAGSVFSSPDLGTRTAPGSAAVITHHVGGFACPDLQAQGSLNVADLELKCELRPDGTSSESMVAKGLDPTQAMAQSNQALAQATGILGAILQAYLGGVRPPAGAVGGAAPPPPVPDGAAAPAGDLGPTRLITSSGWRLLGQ